MDPIQYIQLQKVFSQYISDLNDKIEDPNLSKEERNLLYDEKDLCIEIIDEHFPLED